MIHFTVFLPLHFAPPPPLLLPTPLVRLDTHCMLFTTFTDSHVLNLHQVIINSIIYL